MAKIVLPQLSCEMKAPKSIIVFPAVIHEENMKCSVVSNPVMYESTDSVVSVSTSTGINIQ